ncbi:conserved Plasmodium protein, unknown function [Plasmodium berghei]|uniref:Methyltransferase domain-containing protein n=1 Tax=Plasmodium berghei TaxID=5821 RepID=A0A1C6YR48_PLABE|nr:conserved Plasmodium protein, unknown function [Plasmodium berghei]SCN27493.1 conserved Plasmodium protein, unknown function [Plasmodium berghei]SCO63920.1 conserved Plasmodium protein, unknown function [Plasmodium berghei]
MFENKRAINGIENEINVIEHEINVYNQKETKFEESEKFSNKENVNYNNFTSFVHLICKVKNVRKHGKSLFFCDATLNDNWDNNNNNNLFFYKYQCLGSARKDNNANIHETNKRSNIDKYYLVKNIFNENVITKKGNIQLMINKYFYVNEEKFVLYENYLLNKYKKKYLYEDKETKLINFSLYYSLNLSKKYFSNLENDENKVDENDDTEYKIPLVLLNEYIKHDMTKKLIKTDSLLYIIGFPALTNTNEKSIIVFSSYLLKVNYEYFNIRELLALFGKKQFSVLTLCRSLIVKDDYIYNMYKNECAKKKQYILNIVYKNKNYESISNQKMNNFEIFIIKMIDVIPKLFEIQYSDFKYKINDIQNTENKNILCNDFNLNAINDITLTEDGIIPNKASDNMNEDGEKNEKKKKKKKKKKDIVSYMNNKKIPQIHWMINHIKEILKEIKKKNSKTNFSFYYEDIISRIGDLVNKYIESDSTLFENYLEFLKMFIEKNNNVINEVNVKKINDNYEMCLKKNANIFEKLNWKSIDFYNIKDFYMDIDNIKKEDNVENYDFKQKDEKWKTVYSNVCHTDCDNENKDRTKNEEENTSYKNCEKKKKSYNEIHTNASYNEIIGIEYNVNNRNKTKNGIVTNIDTNNLSYDYCILDVGGGKGDLGIYISLAFKNVLVIILDINVSSLINCFIKIYVNKIKNVLIVHESILNFDFKKYKIDLIVGLHCCGGLTDYTLNKCINETIPFLICSCCYTKFRDLRKYIFDFKNYGIMNEISNYIYKKGYENCQINHEETNKNDIQINDMKWQSNDLVNYTNIINFDRDDKDGSYQIENCIDGENHTDEEDNSDCNNKKSKYDKYGKKKIRRSIPTIYSFVNLLSKLCESENINISHKCMHLYNNIRFCILQKIFNDNNKEGKKKKLTLSLHSFQIAFSPKNIVLKVPSTKNSEECKQER